MSLAGPDTESVDNFANSLNSKKKQAISKFLSFQDPEAVFFFSKKSIDFQCFLGFGVFGSPWPARKGNQHQNTTAAALAFGSRFFKPAELSLNQPKTAQINSKSI